MNVYTGIIQKQDRWWIGCLKEMPNVQSQGETREELIENLESALRDILEANKEMALDGFDEGCEEVTISPQAVVPRTQGEPA